MSDERIKPSSRGDAVSWIAWASMMGRLGFFVGSGFSKAVVGDKAPGFEELLTRVARSLDINSDLNCVAYRRKSFPQIASELLRIYAETHPPLEGAKERFLEEVSQQCNLKPEPAQAKAVGEALVATYPTWIVTTNYDLVLESLIQESESVLPGQPLVPNAARVPIYHLHGHRRYPGTIKITEEDYVSLLGPMDYVRLKLPLLLHESTTVMLGYSLGDINVRAAMEWSRSFHRDCEFSLNAEQGCVFQAVRSVSPKSEPYLGRTGEIVIEIGEIVEFLKEIREKRAELETTLVEIRAKAEAFLSNPADLTALVRNSTTKEQFLSIFEDAVTWGADSALLIKFLDDTLDTIWNLARQRNNFSYYEMFLGLILDLLEKMPLERTRQDLIFYLGDALDKVGWYIDKNKVPGTAWRATDLWLKGHPRISAQLRRELLAYAIFHERWGLKKILQLEVGATDSKVPKVESEAKS